MQPCSSGQGRKTNYLSYLVTGCFVVQSVPWLVYASFDTDFLTFQNYKIKRGKEVGYDRRRREEWIGEMLLPNGS